MRRTLVRHEWRSLTADRSLWVVFAVCALAIAYGTFNGARWTAFQHAAIADARQEETERVRKHEADIVRINRENATISASRDPRNPDAVGRSLGARYAVLPPAALAPLSIGQSDLLPSYFKVTTDARETVLATSELENPHRLLAGRFDLAFVLIYLYPLLILALSYNLLSAEKEDGTLILALSQPVSVRTLVFGKVLLRFIAFLAGVAVLGLLAMLTGGVDLVTPGVVWRLALWFGAVALYGLFWFAAAVAVAALGKPSSTNAILLAGAWLVLVVLVPSLLSMTVTMLYPVPSRVEMIQATRVASDDANAEGSKLLAQYYEDHPELATGDAQQAMTSFNLLRVAVGADVGRRVRPVLERYTTQLGAQQRVVERGRFLSPAVLMQDALNDIAGTGTARHRRFVAQVEAYHQRWRDHFVRLVFQKQLLSDFSAVPRFAFDEEPGSAVVARAIRSLSGLLLPGAVLLAFGVWRLRQYPVVG